MRKKGLWEIVQWVGCRKRVFGFGMTDLTFGAFWLRFLVNGRPARWDV